MMYKKVKKTACLVSSQIRDLSTGLKDFKVYTFLKFRFLFLIDK
jgi:hypothetical protein